MRGKLFFILIVCVLCFASNCKKQDFDIVNLNGNEITILGHGGMGIKNAYPINSAESIVNCLNLNSDGVEIDVQISLDNDLVAFHDEDLSHSTNLHGKVYETSSNRLGNCFYSNPPLSNYQLLKLDNLFNNLSSTDDIYLFDCKIFNVVNTDDLTVALATQVVILIEQYGLEEQVIVESASIDFLNEIKNRNAAIDVCFSSNSPIEAIDISVMNNYNAICFDFENIEEPQISMAHANGLKVILFNTKNRSDHIDAINKNPDIIITDDLKNLIKLLK